jgi:hypothetical protein
MINTEHKGVAQMKNKFAIGTGIIFLQVLIAVQLARAIRNPVAPILAIILFVLAIVALILVFLKLKKRYWFPSLPVQFFLTYLIPLNSELVTCLALFVSIQLIILFVITYMERKSKPVESALADSSAESAEKPKNVFKTSEEVAFLVFLQIAIFFFSNVLDGSDFLASTLLILLSLVPVFFRVQLKRWILSLVISELLTLLTLFFNLFDNSYYSDIINAINFIDLLAIFTCSLYKSISSFLNSNTKFFNARIFKALYASLNKIGVILLHSILIVLISITVMSRTIPLVPAAFISLAIIGLIVIFSSLKMRYWFPSLPMYIVILSYHWVTPIFTGMYDIEFFHSSTLFSVSLQIVIMIVITCIEHYSNPEGALYKSCFGEGLVAPKSIFKLSKKVAYAIILQILIFIYNLCFFDYNHFLPMRYTTDTYPFIYLGLIELFVISVYSIIRLVIKFRKSRKSIDPVFSDPNEQLNRHN